MPPFEVGPARPIGAIDNRLTRKPGGQPERPTAAPADPQGPVVRSEALNPGQAPVDADRVQQIRKAIETGDYPIIPARIADAMIAAGIFLRSSE